MPTAPPSPWRRASSRLGRSLASCGGRPAPASVGRRGASRPASGSSAERLLDAARDRTNPALYALARLARARLLAELRDLSLQLLVLLDQLGDHRVELTYHIAAAGADAGATSLRSGRTAASAWRCRLCFLWCHFLS